MSFASVSRPVQHTNSQPLVSTPQQLVIQPAAITTTQQPLTKHVLHYIQFSRIVSRFLYFNAEAVLFDMTNKDIRVRKQARRVQNAGLFGSVFGVFPIGYYISTKYRHIQSKILGGTVALCILVGVTAFATAQGIAKKHLRPKFIIDYDLPISPLYMANYKEKDFREKKPWM